MDDVNSNTLTMSLPDLSQDGNGDSAPTEYLAEFLSAVMLKDYRKALIFCKMILAYEPNNSTARDFFPIIQQKIKEIDSYFQTQTELTLDTHDATDVDSESEDKISDNTSSSCPSSILEDEEHSDQSGFSNDDESSPEPDVELPIDEKNNNVLMRLSDTDSDENTIDTDFFSSDSGPSGNFGRQSMNYTKSEIDEDTSIDFLIQKLRSKCLPDKNTNK